MNSSTEGLRSTPTISVIMPVLNEANIIQGAVESLSHQSHEGFEIEILAVDGGSNDGTTEILLELQKRIPSLRVLKNARTRTSYALNIGLENSRGEFVATLGAHCKYRNDYLQVCFDELRKTQSAVCGGRVVVKSSSESRMTKLIAYMMGSFFGVSSRSFRNQPEGFASTVPYPLYSKAAMLAAGGFSDDLHRNQDNDLNRKIEKLGNKLYCTHKTECYYYPQRKLKSVLQYAFRTGYWNGKCLFGLGQGMSLRHFIPALFVVSLVALLISGICISFYPVLAPLLLIFGAELAIYFGLGLFEAIRYFRYEREVSAIFLPLLFLSFHISYGLGTLLGLGRGAFHLDRLYKARDAAIKG